MKTKGFTLIEVIVVLTLSLVLILAVTVHFLAEFKVHKSVDDSLEHLRDAQIILAHMTRVLSIVKGNPLQCDTNQGIIVAWVHDNIMPAFPQNSRIRYHLFGTRLRFRRDTPTVTAFEDLSRHVLDFDPVWNAATGLFEIDITIGKPSEPGKAIRIQTEIRPGG